ncbi:MAG: hypothetical protein HY070_11650, partial [Chloroflexi bacterium]|nr:hypothetical protein [Chloroflexota bacterium]
MRKLFLAFLGVILLGLQFAPMANADRCDATAITAPARSETVGGMVTIIGRANLSDSFVRYQVDFATAGKEDWLEINELAFAVLNDAVLARWDTNAISEGAYDLRVRAIDRTGNYCEQIVASVRVARNAARQELNGEPIRIPTLTGAFYVALPALPKIETCTHSWDVGAQVT